MIIEISDTIAADLHALLHDGSNDPYARTYFVPVDLKSSAVKLLQQHGLIKIAPMKTQSVAAWDTGNEILVDMPPVMVAKITEFGRMVWEQYVEKPVVVAPADGEYLRRFPKPGVVAR